MILPVGLGPRGRVADAVLASKRVFDFRVDLLDRTAFGDLVVSATGFMRHSLERLPPLLARERENRANHRARKRLRVGKANRVDGQAVWQ